MFSWKRSESDHCGLIVDIGSGSVGMAVVYQPAADEPVSVVWNYREFALLKNSTDTADAMKRIQTAIVNAFLAVAGDGTKALHAFNPSLSVASVQVSFSAPWSHTVTRTVAYSDDTPFVVTQALLTELTTRAQSEAAERFSDLDLEQQKLTSIADATASLMLNGYVVTAPLEQTTTQLSVTHLNAVTYQTLYNTVTESIEKVFPQAETTFHSFMFLYYCLLRNTQSQLTDICLLDVTHEATELGIIRDGALIHATHNVHGAHSVAREISNAATVPLEEAYSWVQDTGLANSSGEIQAVSEAYQKTLLQLFSDTGDDLGVPQTIFLHCPAKTGKYFSSQIQAAADSAAMKLRIIQPVTAKLIDEALPLADTALAVSISFWQQRSSCLLTSGTSQ